MLAVQLSITSSSQISRTMRSGCASLLRQKAGSGSGGPMVQPLPQNWSGEGIHDETDSRHVIGL
jgi:hypothetical protein